MLYWTYGVETLKVFRINTLFSSRLISPADPIFLSMIEDIFKSLAASSASGVGDVVLQQALPGLSDALIHASVEETWIASSALGLLVGLVRGTPSEKLSQQFFSSVAPGLFKCLAESDDRGVLENGIIFLTIMTRKNCGQIIAWKDGEGTSGLEYVLRLVAKQLRDQDESGGLVIGDLIIQLMRQAGEAILPVVPELLKEMISRMRNAKTATYTQVRNVSLVDWETLMLMSCRVSSFHLHS